MDLGSFLSRLDEVGAPSELGKQFVDGYREVTDEMPDLSLVELSIAVSHFQRALFPLRNLEPEWPARTLRLLDLSEEHLRESLR